MICIARRWTGSWKCLRWLSSVLEALNETVLLKKHCLNREGVKNVERHRPFTHSPAGAIFHAIGTGEHQVSAFHSSVLFVSITGTSRVYAVQCANQE